MAKRDAYTCDICGKQKGSVNHWWLIAEDETAFRIEPWSDNEIVEMFDHACGHECAGKFLSRWMQERQTT